MGPGFIDAIESLHLPDLPPLTTVLVWTMNSMYRLVVTHGDEAYVQGGTHFRTPTPARIHGTLHCCGPMDAGWIGVGLMLELHAGPTRVVTSPIVAISTERACRLVLH
jgi:hypothetical protein